MGCLGTQNRRQKKKRKEWGRERKRGKEKENKQTNEHRGLGKRKKTQQVSLRRAQSRDRGQQAGQAGGQWGPAPGIIPHRPLPPSSGLGAEPDPDGGVRPGQLQALAGAGVPPRLPRKPRAWPWPVWIAQQTDRWTEGGQAWRAWQEGGGLGTGNQGWALVPEAGGQGRDGAAPPGPVCTAAAREGAPPLPNLGLCPCRVQPLSSREPSCSEPTLPRVYADPGRDRVGQLGACTTSGAQDSRRGRDRLRGSSGVPGGGAR